MALYLKSGWKMEGVRHEVKTVEDMTPIINSHIITINTEISGKN